MIIDITKDELINDTHSFKDLEGTGIIKLDNISITGEHVKNEVKLTVKGIMVLPCAVSLKPVDYSFEVEIEEKIEENLKNNQNTIDILPIIWENILAEIPIRVVSEDLTDIKKSGDGWILIDEKGTKTNPELEKLKDLL